MPNLPHTPPHSHTSTAQATHAVGGNIEPSSIPPRIKKCQILGRRDQDSTTNGNLLRDGQLNIACAWWHVDYEHIQLTPRHLRNSGKCN